MSGAGYETRRLAGAVPMTRRDEEIEIEAHVLAEYRFHRVTASAAEQAAAYLRGHRVFIQRLRGGRRYCLNRREVLSEAELVAKANAYRALDGLEPIVGETAEERAARRAAIERWARSWPAAEVLRDFARDVGRWTGTTLSLLTELNARAGPATRAHRRWPRVVGGWGGFGPWLANNEAALEQLGVGVQVVGFDRRRRAKILRVEYVGGGDAENDGASESR